MRKLLKSMKTLLIAAGLLVGTNSAWADTYEILYGNAVEENGVITGVTAQTDFTDTYATTLDATDGNGNTSLNISGSVLATTTEANWTKNFSSDITTGKVYFSGIYRIAANTNQRIRIVDSTGNVIFGTAQNNTGGNADQIVAYICGTEISNWVRQPRSAGYGVDEICIDLDAKTVNYTLTVSSGNGSTTKKTGTVDFPYDNVRGLYFCKASGDGYRTFLDNVKFYSVVSSEPEYTINYKLGDNVVRTVNGRAAVGETVSASMAINGTGDYAGNHYLITAATAPTMTIVDGTNVLDVPVRVPYTATLSVTTTVNGVAGEPVVTNLTETDEKVCAWSFSYPMYQKSGDVFYACDETTYVQSGTFTNGESVNKTVTYNTADESIMAFSEVGSNGTNPTYSGGAYSDTFSQLASCTLNKGVYKTVIVVVSKAGSGKSHRTESLMVGGNAVASTENGTNKTYEFFFTVAEDNTEAYVKGNGTSNATDNLDYVIIKRLPDNVSATITSAGWATLYTPYALNFADAEPTGLEAYTATLNGSTVTLTKVDNIPANTGVVLKGGANTYSIPVIANSSTAQGSLQGSTTEDKAATSESPIYILKLNANNEAQFMRATSGSLDAGKAYLELTTQAKALTVVFANDPTGIATVNAAEAAQPAKRIENGQLIIEKNGKRYNAAGAEL